MRGYTLHTGPQPAQPHAQPAPWGLARVRTLKVS